MRLAFLIVAVGALAQGASARLPFEVDRVAVDFHPGGRVAAVAYYRGGEKVGVHQAFDADGTLRARATFVAGLYQGEAREWHANGRLARVRHFEAGREAGLQQAWTDDGTLFLNYEARDGRRYGLVNATPCAPVHGKETP